MCLMTNRCFQRFISSAPSAGALGYWRGVICQTSLFSTLFLFVHRLVPQFSTPTERERRFVGEEGVSGDWSAKGKRIPSRKSQAAFISLDAVDLRDLFSAILGMFIGRVRKGDLLPSLEKTAALHQAVVRMGVTLRTLQAVTR